MMGFCAKRKIALEKHGRGCDVATTSASGSGGNDELRSENMGERYELRKST